MQDSRKIFRNCPYAGLNIACEHCSNYENCMKEKRKRQKRREIERTKRAKKKRLLLILLIIALVISSLKFCSNAEGNENPESDAEETTIATVPETTNETETTEPEIETVVVEITEATEFIQILENEESTEVAVENTETGDVTIQISAEGPGETYVYHITEEEKILIARMVYAESRGECFEGKVAVAAVLLNRWVTDDPIFAGQSIEQLIRASGQFASINWVTESHLAQVPECMEAVEAALKGWDPTRGADENGNVLFPDGAKYFYAPASIDPIQMECREGVPTLYIGNHAFHDTFNTVG